MKLHNMPVYVSTVLLLSGGGPEDRTGVFALCIIQRPHDGKFLMTQEFAGRGQNKTRQQSCSVCVTLHHTSAAASRGRLAA